MPGRTTSPRLQPDRQARFVQSRPGVRRRDRQWPRPRPGWARTRSRVRSVQMPCPRLEVRPTSRFSLQVAVGRTSITNWPRNAATETSKQSHTLWAAFLGARGQRSVHDAVHRSALEVHDVHLAQGILAKRADLDGLKAQLDACPTSVVAADEREHAPCAQVAEEVLARQAWHALTTIRVATHDRAVHIMTVGHQRRHEAGIVAA